MPTPAAVSLRISADDVNVIKTLNSVRKSVASLSDVSARGSRITSASFSKNIQATKQYLQEQEKARDAYVEFWEKGLAAQEKADAQAERSKRAQRAKEFNRILRDSRLISEDAARQLAADFSDVEGSLSKATAAFKRAERESESYRKSQRDLGNDIKTAYNRGERATDSLRNAQKQLRPVLSGISRAFDSRKIEQTFRRTKFSINDAGGALTALAGPTNLAIAGFGRLGLSVASGIGAVPALANLAGEALQVLSDTVVRSVRSASDLQFALAEVGTISEEVAKNIGGFSERIGDLAIDTRTDSSLLSAGLYQTISAGITDVEEAFTFLESAARGARAGLTSVEVSVDGLSSVINAYGLDAREANRISDILFSTVRQGKLRFDEVARSIGKVAPLAANLNVTVEEMFSAFAALTLGGVNAREAATGLANLLTAILKPAADSRQAAESLGLAFDSAALKAQGLRGFLDSLQGALNVNFEGVTIDATDLHGVMNELELQLGDNVAILGRLFPNVRALRAAIQLTGNQGDDFIRILDDMAKSSGSTDRALEILNSTLRGQYDLVRQQFNKALEEIGYQTLPVLTDALQDISEYLRNVDWERFRNEVGATVKVVEGLSKVLLTTLDLVKLLPGIRSIQIGAELGQRAREAGDRGDVLGFAKQAALAPTAPLLGTLGLVFPILDPLQQNRLDNELKNIEDNAKIDTNVSLVPLPPLEVANELKKLEKDANINARLDLVPPTPKALFESKELVTRTQEQLAKAIEAGNIESAQRQLSISLDAIDADRKIQIRALQNSEKDKEKYEAAKYAIDVRFARDRRTLAERTNKEINTLERAQLPALLSIDDYRKADAEAKNLFNNISEYRRDAANTFQRIFLGPSPADLERSNEAILKAKDTLNAAVAAKDIEGIRRSSDVYEAALIANTNLEKRDNQLRIENKSELAAQLLRSENQLARELLNAKQNEQKAILKIENENNTAALKAAEQLAKDINDVRQRAQSLVIFGPNPVDLERSNQAVLKARDDLNAAVLAKDLEGIRRATAAKRIAQTANFDLLLKEAQFTITNKDELAAREIQIEANKQRALAALESDYRRNVVAAGAPGFSAIEADVARSSQLFSTLSNNAISSINQLSNATSGSISDVIKSSVKEFIIGTTQTIAASKIEFSLRSRYEDILLAKRQAYNAALLQGLSASAAQAAASSVGGSFISSGLLQSLGVGLGLTGLATAFSFLLKIGDNEAREIGYEIDRSRVNRRY